MAEMRPVSNLVDLPDFKIDKSEIPFIRLKSIQFQNFKVFKDYLFNFWGDLLRVFMDLMDVVKQLF